LRLAQWRASRDGVRGELLDPVDHTPRPAADIMQKLLQYVGPALEANGDSDRVSGGVDRVLSEGTGADLQRKALTATADLAEVVRTVVAITRA
jgi:carboxylate-amine ligase